MNKGGTSAFQMNSCLKNLNFPMTFHYVNIYLWWSLIELKRSSDLVKELISRPLPTLMNSWRAMKTLLTCTETMVLTKQCIVCMLWSQEVAPWYLHWGPRFWAGHGRVVRGCVIKGLCTYSFVCPAASAPPRRLLLSHCNVVGKELVVCLPPW